MHSRCVPGRQPGVSFVRFPNPPSFPSNLPSIAKFLVFQQVLACFCNMAVAVVHEKRQLAGHDRSHDRRTKALPPQAARNAGIDKGPPLARNLSAADAVGLFSTSVQMHAPAPGFQRASIPRSRVLSEVKQLSISMRLPSSPSSAHGGRTTWPGEIWPDKRNQKAISPTEGIVEYLEVRLVSLLGAAGREDQLEVVNGGRAQNVNITAG